MIIARIAALAIPAAVAMTGVVNSPAAASSLQPIAGVQSPSVPVSAGQIAQPVAILLSEGALLICAWPDEYMYD